MTLKGDKMKCHECSAETLFPEKRDVPYEYKGQITIIPRVGYLNRRHFGESFRSITSNTRFTELVDQFKRRIDATQ